MFSVRLSKQNQIFRTKEKSHVSLYLYNNVYNIRDIQTRCQTNIKINYTIKTEIFYLTTLGTPRDYDGDDASSHLHKSDTSVLP